MASPSTSPGVEPQASNEFPSLLPPTLLSPKPPSPVSTAVLSTSRAQREKFVREQLPTRVQVMLDQPFGKDCLTQSFTTEACFRLVLLPLVRSRFLTPVDWQNLETASLYAFLLAQLLREYSQLDFRPLRGFPTGWSTESEVNLQRQRMTTAAVLHWDGDLATVVRWIGGPHVAAHRDHHATLAKLEGVVEPEIISGLRRLWFFGAPAHCNGSASEANFQAFRRYGNHSTVLHDPFKTYQALVKDNKRGFCLTMDPRLVHFILHAHLTPQGMVDLNKIYKSPRPIFDSTF